MLQRLFYLSAFATLTVVGCYADEILPEKTDEVPQELVMNDETSDENSDEQNEETQLACSCKKKNRHFFQDEDQGDQDSDETLVFNDDEQNDENSDEALVFNDEESTEDQETSEELFV